MTVLFLLTIFPLVQNSAATTEWFGDLRAWLYPEKNPPFYDIVYENSECPFGIQSNAIPDFVYFGKMITSRPVRDHAECIQRCLQTSHCSAVNFFESVDAKMNNGMPFCELLSENQFDNPRLMRPFRKATYYENIHCRPSSDADASSVRGSGSAGGDDEVQWQDGYKVLGKLGKRPLSVPGSSGNSIIGGSVGEVGVPLTVLTSREMEGNSAMTTQTSTTETDASTSADEATIETETTSKMPEIETTMESSTERTEQNDEKDATTETVADESKDVVTDEPSNKPDQKKSTETELTRSVEAEDAGIGTKNDGNEGVSNKNATEIPSSTVENGTAKVILHKAPLISTENATKTVLDFLREGRAKLENIAEKMRKLNSSDHFN